MGFFDTLLGKKVTNTSAAAAAPTVQKKVLIVEDDAYLRDFYVELLKTEGFAVVTAENGQKGYDMVVAEKPDLVMTDLMMPVMDGKQMLHNIRLLPEFKMLPIIVLTNAGSVDNLTETKVYNNASDFLIKANVQPNEIVAKIKSLTSV